MFIKLSSKNQLDPARFKNSFLDQLVIKPNSAVCLTMASLARDGDIVDIIFDTPTNFFMKFNAYQYKVLVIPAGTYTLKSLSDYMDNILNDDPQISAFEAFGVQIVPGSFPKKSLITMVNAQDGTSPDSLSKYLHNNEYWNEMRGISTVPGFSNPILTFQGNQTVGISLITNQKNAYNPYWSAGSATIPTIVPNKAYCCNVQPGKNNNITNDEITLTQKMRTGAGVSQINIVLNYGHAESDGVDMSKIPIGDGTAVDSGLINYQVQFNNNGEAIYRAFNSYWFTLYGMAPGRQACF